MIFRSRPGRFLLAVGAGLAVAVMAAFASALVLAVIDLYLSGHSSGSITRPLIVWPGLGVSLSPADTVLLAVSVVAGCSAGWIVWRVSGPR